MTKQGVRHCLITAAAVRGEEPAHYFSRGQRHAFQEAMDAENSGKKAIGEAPRADEHLKFAGEEKLRAVG